MHRRFVIKHLITSMIIDSYAPKYQSINYGGYTPGDGTFALFQSHASLAVNEVEDEGGALEQGLLSRLIGWGLFTAGFHIVIKHIFQCN